MQPPRVASAAWVFASSPSKVPFYIAGSLLAGWAVLVAAWGITHHEFPGSVERARLVMLASATLVAATIATAIATAGGPAEESEESEETAAGPAPTSETLGLTADPSGEPAYDKKRAAVRAGKVEIRFTSRSSVAHNVTIAKGSESVTATKTITGGTTATTVNLRPGDYVYYCSVDAHRQSGMEGTLSAR